jgi:hypothetical protein
MAAVAESVVRKRLERAAKVTEQYAKEAGAGSKEKKHTLADYNAFCLTPEEIMAKVRGKEDGEEKRSRGGEKTGKTAPTKSST